MPAALVFYEAPHRIEETVADLAALLEPERDMVIARELTKLFEQIARMPLAEAPAWLAADANRRRGEFVCCVSGAARRAQGLDAETERVLRLLLAELPLEAGRQAGGGDHRPAEERAVRAGAGTQGRIKSPPCKRSPSPAPTTGTCTCATARRWPPCCPTRRAVSPAPSSCPTSSRR